MIDVKNNAVSKIAIAALCFAFLIPNYNIQAQDLNLVSPTTLSAVSENGNLSQSVNERFAKFIPQPDGRGRKLDYRIFDEILAKVVVDLGPSTRIWQRRPEGELGSRIVTGHKSPFRLEGKRFTFSYINDEYTQGVSDYRKDLEALATKYDITTFPKDEQLAFWFNLHNVAVIEQIALDYPTKRPEKIKIQTLNGKAELNDAKFITIKGQALSLRDIRENIVYANWKDPNVIYGFFRGDIGSPSIQEYAFTPERMSYMLESNANDFVNSLRGYRRASGIGKISKIYQSESRFFFPNWPADIKSHLLSHANETVKAEILQLSAFVAAPYDSVVADLAGGGTPRVRNLAVQSSNPFNDANKNLPPEIARILRETEDKYRILRQRGVVGRVNNGTVVISDIETDDPDEEGSLTGKP